MKDLLVPGGAALTLVALIGVAGCNPQRPQQEKVVERVVIHDRPVIVRQEGDRRDGDRREADRPGGGQMGDRRDSPPPDQAPDQRGAPQDNRR